MSKFIVVLALISIIVAFIVVLTNHIRTKKTMDTLEKMIDSAADGEYSCLLYTSDAADEL